MKKLFALILTAALVLSFTACGGDNSQPSTGDNSDPAPVATQRPEDKDQADEFSQKELFVGYNIYHPDFGRELGRSDYGYMFKLNECMVYMEDPATASVILEARTLEDALLLSEPYIYNSVEKWTAFMFMVDRTVLNITEKETKTVNGIEMLRVTGTLDATSDNKQYDFAGYFFTGGSTYPTYIYGYEMAGATMDIVEFMDEMASHITKN